MRVIYSFTDVDPEDITGLEYHGSTNRGTKSVVLINNNDGNQTLPDDTITMDFLITEVCVSVYQYSSNLNFEEWTIHKSVSKFITVQIVEHFSRRLRFQGREWPIGVKFWKFLRDHKNITLSWQVQKP